MIEDVAQTLDAIISQELLLYAEYQKLLVRERQALRKSDSDQIQVLADERGEVVDALSMANDQRCLIIREVSKERHLKLSTFIERFLTPQEQKQLMPKVKALKVAVAGCRSESSEFGQVVNFALKVTSGLVSILWSATQNVVRSYGRTGTMREAYHPSQGHAGSILKKV